MVNRFLLKPVGRQALRDGGRGRDPRCAHLNAGAGDQEKWVKKSSCQITSTYRIPKTILALVQVVPAVPLIGRARESEDGYTAYQLTLIQYALLSLLNIVNAFFALTYPTLYMIKTELWKRRRDRGGGVFRGHWKALRARDCRARPTPPITRSSPGRLAMGHARRE